jgi:hypothetical protein
MHGSPAIAARWASLAVIAGERFSGVRRFSAVPLFSGARARSSARRRNGLRFIDAPLTVVVRGNAPDGAVARVTDLLSVSG